MARIAIIGAGLAGSAAAYILSQTGASITIYEATNAPASGASGNEVGLYNPRFFAHYDEQAKFYWDAFHNALTLFRTHGDQFNHNECGALHLINTEQKEKRFHKLTQNWPIKNNAIQILTQQKASEIAGIDLQYDALYLPHSGTVSPKKLCAFYIKQSGATLHYNNPICDAQLKDLQNGYDAVIVACAMSTQNFEATKHLPLKAIRGQITEIKTTSQSEKLKTVLCYGSYLTPQTNGHHIVGSSFDRGVNNGQIKDSDNADNIAKMITATPALNGDYHITNARASVRTTAQSHSATIGQVIDNIYISTAHGSHGILSSLAAAQHLKQIIVKN